jgi:hypothetical protein
MLVVNALRAYCGLNELDSAGYPTQKMGTDLSSPPLDKHGDCGFAVSGQPFTSYEETLYLGNRGDWSRVYI